MNSQDQHNSTESNKSYLFNKISPQKVDSSKPLHFNATSPNADTPHLYENTQYYGIYGHSSGPTSTPSGQKSYLGYGANIFQK